MAGLCTMNVLRSGVPNAHAPWCLRCEATERFSLIDGASPSELGIGLCELHIPSLTDNGHSLVVLHWNAVVRDSFPHHDLAS